MTQKTDVIIRYTPALLAYLAENAPEWLTEEGDAVSPILTRVPARPVSHDGFEGLWQFARLRPEHRDFWQGVADDPASRLEIVAQAPRDQSNPRAVYRAAEAEGGGVWAFVQAATYVAPQPVLDKHGQPTGDMTPVRYDEPSYM